MLLRSSGVAVVVEVVVVVVVVVAVAVVTVVVVEVVVVRGDSVEQAAPPSGCWRGRLVAGAGPLL